MKFWGYFIKFIIIGSTGMLGNKLYNYLSELGNSVIGIARKEADYNIDITNDKELIKCFNKEKPDVIINTVAIVNLDYCENNPCEAYLTNTRPVSIISEYCEDNDIYFVQISTDHYYSGDKNKLHDEKDDIKLLNEYSRTKFLAECLALNNPNALIVRTNIVGYRDGSDTFVDWVLDSLTNKKLINVFNDYFVSSIDTYNFSKILFDLIKKGAKGIYNISSREAFSKEEFIFAIAGAFKLSTSFCTSVSIKDVGMLNRAESLGLNTEKTEKFLGYALPNLSDVVYSLKNNY